MSPSPEKETLQRALRQQHREAHGPTCECRAFEVESVIAEQVEDHWPVLLVAHFQRQNEYKGLALPLPGGPVGSWVPAYPQETYHPESAPNVLSPDEARLIIDNLHMPVRRSLPEAQKVRELWERISAWAEAEETKFLRKQPDEGGHS